MKLKLHVCTYVRTYVLCACMHTHGVYVRMFVRTYIRMYVRMYLRTYVQFDRYRYSGHCLITKF